MSDYLGNPSLSPAVKDRVVSTFQQTLALYKQGRGEEVIQGCGLILRMDPMFDPAKKLLEKARNPAAPIDVDALGSAAEIGDPMAEARQAMAARDFQRVVNLTTEVLTNDLLNDEARVLNEQAREKMEAAPFIDQFARKFDQLLAQGNATAARAEIEKARALDSDHPSIARMQAALGGAKPAAPAPAPASPAGGFSFDSPSFVVDNPAPSARGRGTAQATDFGFTFEEEKPAAPAPSGGGFSFEAPSAPAAPPDSGFGGFSFGEPAAADPFANFKPSAPPEPPPAPSGGGGFSFDAPPAEPAPSSFDFSSASVATSADDQAKIQQYLGDGDRAYDSGDYQKAIDLWSRIFLIDVTNDEASQRIEKAKGKRREAEQKTERILADGIAAWEKHDNTTARSKFEEVLRVDPNNTTAHDYLDRMSDTVAEGGAPAFSAPYNPPAPVLAPDLFDEDAMGAPSTTPLLPPEPSAAPATGKRAAAKPAKAPSRGLPKGAIIAVVVAIVVIAGGWFAWTKFVAKPSYDPAATAAVFKQAGALAQRGQFDQAIAMLQDVKPDDPQHDKALNMIADLQHKKSQAAEMVNGRPAAAVYQEDLDAGKAAFANHDYDAAKKAFDAAVKIKPLPADTRALYDEASQQVAKLDSAKSLFQEQKYADAIASLQPLLQADPQNVSIKRIISDAHFDLGATALQEERTGDAIKEFDQVLQANANDELAKRSKALAERYNDQPKDLLYKIYVKYLPLRKVS